MEHPLFIIAMITAGVALISGFNSMIVGITKQKGGRVEIIFGIQCFLMFVYLVFPPTGFILRDHPPYPWMLDMKRIFSWFYYGMFPFFFEGYSGYKNRILKWGVVGLLVSCYLVYLTTGTGAGLPLWRFFVIVPLGLIGVHGLLAAQHMRSKGNVSEGRWVLAAIVIYILLYVISAGYIIKGNWLERYLGYYPFFLFHLSGLAFILIMSIRLNKDAANRLKLEKILRTKEDRWEQLLASMQLVAVELDREGNIVYCNPFAVRLLGARTSGDLIGRNWFRTFTKPASDGRLRTIFSNVVEGGMDVPGMDIIVVGLDTKEHHIRWTGVKLFDEQGKVKSIMGLGVDRTALDHAFREVEELKNELLKENVLVYDENEAGSAMEIIGHSDAIEYAIQKAKQVAITHATVLLEGETGVGKELFANLIHSLSERNIKPLIKVNCAALPHELIESELFGHEKGSFTGAIQARKGRFELADKGTIFLDEISELPLALQSKLLRVLQSGEFERIGGQQTIKVDVRVISATNRNLLDEVRVGKFRNDLYYRLNVYPITIPSLRNRRSDIPLLVDHYIRKFAMEFGKDIRNISKADIKRLEEYDWPGNIRELVNLIERSVITSPGETLRIAWEKDGHRQNGLEKEISSIHHLEKEHILKVLKAVNWKINGPGGAAEQLGLNPNTLRSRMKKLNIARETH